MDFQIVSVGIIVFAALIYIGLTLRRKIKSFSAQSSCEIDCGCNGKKKPKRQDLSRIREKFPAN